MPPCPPYRTPLRSYQELLVWQKGMAIVDLSFTLSRSLPSHQRFGLASQMERAAISIPANIAEGYGRGHLGDYLRHLWIANGSLKELETHYLISAKQGFLRENQLETALEMTGDLGRMLTVLLRRLKQRRTTLRTQPPTP